jgi:hypothetical protein
MNLWLSLISGWVEHGTGIMTSQEEKGKTTRTVEIVLLPRVNVLLFRMIIIDLCFTAGKSVVRSTDGIAMTTEMGTRHHGLEITVRREDGSAEREVLKEEVPIGRHAGATTIAGGIDPPAVLSHRDTGTTVLVTRQKLKEANREGTHQKQSGMERRRSWTN